MTGEWLLRRDPVHEPFDLKADKLSFYNHLRQDTARILLSEQKHMSMDEFPRGGIENHGFPGVEDSGGMDRGQAGTARAKYESAIEES